MPELLNYSESPGTRPRGFGTASMICAIGCAAILIPAQAGLLPNKHLLPAIAMIFLCCVSAGIATGVTGLFLYGRGRGRALLGLVLNVAILFIILPLFG